MTTETNNQTTQTVSDFIRAAVQQREDALARKLTEEERQEREAAEAREARRQKLEAELIAQLPEPLRPFAHLPTPAGYYPDKLMLMLPDCAPFGVKVMRKDDDTVLLSNTHFVLSMLLGGLDDNGDDYGEPYIETVGTPYKGALAEAIALSYETQREYQKAHAEWMHRATEQGTALEMSANEAQRRHDEEPEEMLKTVNQPAYLTPLTSDEILALADECIRKMDMAGTDSERYLYRRAMALCAYVSARNSQYIGLAVSE